MPLLQSAVVGLSESFGLPLPFIRNALMVLSALPFSAVHLAVPSDAKTARQWTSILLSTGLFLALFPLDGFVTILGTSLTVRDFVC